MAGRLTGHKALVTGGAGGIGRAIALALAREIGRHGITVNVVSPGVVEDYDLTVAEARRRKDKETATGRPGTVADIANAVVFLCTEEASFITGDVLNVTGGWLL